MSSSCEVIGKNLLKKETNVQPFLNLKVTLSTGEVGIIEGSFGQSGKVKIRVMGMITKLISSFRNINFSILSKDGLKDDTQSVLAGTNKKKKAGDPPVSDEKHAQVKIQLCFKRYIYDPHKKMIQT